MNVQETIVPLFKNKNNVESNQAVVNRETPEVPNTDTVFVPVDPNEIENGVDILIIMQNWKNLVNV